MPYGVRIAASWGWRLIVIVVAVGIAVWLLSQVSLLVIPLMIAALLAGLLSPVVHFLHDKARMPKGLAVGITMIGFLALVVGGLSVVGQRLATGFSSLWAQALTGVTQIQHWLSVGPLAVSNEDLDALDPGCAEPAQEQFLEHRLRRTFLGHHAGASGHGHAAGAFLADLPAA